MQMRRVRAAVAVNPASSSSVHAQGDEFVQRADRAGEPERREVRVGAGFFEVGEIDVTDTRMPAEDGPEDGR
jgi:hypothetical protein